MANYFDQFDAPAEAGSGNFFDRFDAQPPTARMDPRATLGDALLGGAELLYTGATGATGAITGGLAYGGAAVGRALGADVDPAEIQRRTQQYFTHQPVTQGGQAGAAKFANVARRVGDVLDVPETMKAAGELTRAVEERSPFAGSLLRATPGAFQAASSLVPMAATARSMATAPFNPTAPRVPTPVRGHPTAEEVVSQLDTQQSMGAAAAAPNLQNVSPELREAIVQTAQRTGGAVNPETLSRHIDADTVFRGRARLSDGQASGDVRLISEEQNMRGRVQGVAEQFDAQNRALGEFMRDLRDEHGPDVFSANTVEHGDTLIAAYKAQDAAARGAINQAYKAARDANGGELPMNGAAFVTAADTALKQNMKGRYVPAEVAADLAEIRQTGAMNFETFENLRTNLAAEARKADRSGDGNAAAAVRIVRDALESIEPAGSAADVKPLFDRARSLAKARFDALDTDPAYKAAVEDTVAPDRFVNRFVIGGNRDDLARMKATIGGDESAAQTMGVAALDHLRDQARLSPAYEGNFASASYGKALQKLSPSIRSLLPARAIEQLEQLGRVAGYTTAQPRGSFVNNSNTFTAAAADKTKSTLEGMANVAFGGVPVGTWTRKGIEGASDRRRAREMFAAGAGLSRLKPSAKLQTMMDAARRKAAQ